MSNENLNNMEKFLEEQGIDRNSYVLIDTEKDNYIKPFNAPNEAVEKLDFEYDKERIEKYGLPFVNGYNNGTSSILFANGVCVVSQSPEMQDLIQKMADGASQHLEKNALSAMNQMGVPLSNWETLVSQDGSANSQTAEVETMKATCDAIKEAKANQKDAQLRESVASQLEEMGLQSGSYTILTEKDDGIGIKAQDGNIYPFDLRQVARESKNEVIADTNGGVAAFYFKDGAYVISTTEQAEALANQIQRENGETLGVIAQKDKNIFYTKDPLLTNNREPLDSLNGAWNDTLQANEERVSSREADDNQNKKDSVATKLEAMGIEAGTYMMFTEQDAKGVCAQTLNKQQCPISASLREGVHKIGENDVIASQNSGVAAFYFEEGVYVVSPSKKAIEKAHEIENQKGFVGVSIGKEPNFSNTEGEALDNLNDKWANVCETVNKNEIKERQESMGLEFSEALYKKGVYNDR